MKDPAGYVGEMFGKEKNVMELRRIMELANVNDQVEEVESIEERCDSFQVRRSVEQSDEWSDDRSSSHTSHPTHSPPARPPTVTSPFSLKCL